MPGKPEAVKSVEAEKAAESKKFKDEKLDERLKETFPASDPISVSTPTKPAGPPVTDGGAN